MIDNVSVFGRALRVSAAQAMDAEALTVGLSRTHAHRDLLMALRDRGATALVAD